MSDRFHPLSLQQLSTWIAEELDSKGSVFGIPRDLFFVPSDRDPFAVEVYDRKLENPLGVAAGPHSQLAQNIIVAWLCGARFIELKTVQTLDQLEVPKPCIDMQDEGYNVEWSQELRVEQSFREYLHAWVLIHALHQHLGFPGSHPGLIFNLSVGYNLEGILQPNMQWFLDTMEDSGPELAAAIDTVSKSFPEVDSIGVPSMLSDNVTLSTMHGCPPEEIGAISEYLMKDRGLHTSVKLNPTLLGPKIVRRTLNEDLGFSEIEITDEAFAHDLVFDDALRLIRHLQTTAIEEDLVFGVKLTNTLEVSNHRTVFDAAETTMYLSGRPLHALTVQLAHRLAEEVRHPLLMSFSGGADAGNVASLLRAGMKTVTVCSDLLKPGGYLRLGQYLDNITNAMRQSGSDSIDEFIRHGAPDGTTTEGARYQLRILAEEVVDRRPLHKKAFERSHTKTRRGLGLFDCIDAPCTDICDVDQNVPAYMRLVRDGDFSAASEVTREDNPLASILGRTCHNPCEPVCLRTHMDQPLAIREIKRFITDQEAPPPRPTEPALKAPRTAVIGAGPCGLAAATFLARAGRSVTVFEARPASGGMVSATIPDYRAASHAVDRDIDRIAALGTEFRYNQEIGRETTLETLREEGFSAIVIAAGARRGLHLGIEGEENTSVLDGLDFLRGARKGDPPALGQRVGVIGGGDVAMDCARTAVRLTGGEVTVFYRRTRAEMPAQNEELEDLFAEGGQLVELAAPLRLVIEGGRLEAVEMATMELGEPDASGRRRPTAVPGGERQVALDTLIIAIGQQPDLRLFGDTLPRLNRKGYVDVDPVTFETSLPGVYAGGDIVGDGPSSIIKAGGDGRRIAEAILAGGQPRKDDIEPKAWPGIDRTDILKRRARSEDRIEIPRLEPARRDGFAEVIQTLSPAAAQAEASRCLDCDLMCSTCDGVCPNRAIMTYHARPDVLGIPELDDDGLQTGSKDFPVAQGPQVAVLTDACNECGNCVTFCPTQGRPWLDKPRMYLHRGEFDEQTENAFMLVEDRGFRGLDARWDDALHRLLSSKEGLRYVTPSIDVLLDPEELRVLRVHRMESSKEHQAIDTTALGTMVTLLRSFSDSMPEFPLIAVEAD